MNGPMKGLALPAALVTLLIMTLLGVATYTTVSLELRMNAATYDRQLAFQAAEAALRLGERVAEEITDPSQYCYPKKDKDKCTGQDPNNVCNNFNNCRDGICQQPDSDCPRRWLAPDFRGWRRIDQNLAKALGPPVLDPRDPRTWPEFFVEHLDNDSNNCSLYRITARSRAPGQGRAVVMLQSIYAVGC